MLWDYSLYRGFRYSGLRYSKVRFHIFYCNSAGLSNVVRCNGVFVTVGFVIAGCHSFDGNQHVALGDPRI